jgi:hypothetical protein
MWTSQPCRSRWHIVAGQPRIDAMDRRGERRDYRNRKDGCEDRQSHMRTPSVAPVEIVVHGQNPLELESTQPPGAGSAKREIGIRGLPQHWRPEADHGMGDDDVAQSGGWAISGSMTLATILLLWHFPNLTVGSSVSSATWRACDGRSGSRGIWFGSICCEQRGGPLR